MNPMIFTAILRRRAPRLLMLAGSLAYLLAYLLAATNAQAGRPMTVDDASIAAPGQCQLETYLQHADQLNLYWATPACNAGGDWELAIGAAWADDSSAARKRIAHFGRLQAKTVFKPLETNGWGLGMVLADQFRAGRAGDGDLSVNVPLSVSLDNDAMLVHFNLGLMRSDAQSRNNATWGSGAQFNLDPRNTLTAELFGQQRGGSRYQFGLAHALIPDRLQVDATWGRRLARGADEQVVTLGLVLQSRP